MGANITSVGFCVECKSNIHKVADGFACRCGTVHKDSTYLPTCWVMPGLNLVSLETSTSQDSSASAVSASHNVTPFPRAGNF